MSVARLATSALRGSAPPAPRGCGCSCLAGRHPGPRSARPAPPGAATHRQRSSAPLARSAPRSGPSPTPPPAPPRRAPIAPGPPRFATHPTCHAGCSAAHPPTHGLACCAPFARYARSLAPPMQCCGFKPQASKRAQASCEACRECIVPGLRSAQGILPVKSAAPSGSPRPHF